MGNGKRSGCSRSALLRVSVRFVEEESKMHSFVDSVEYSLIFWKKSIE